MAIISKAMVFLGLLIAAYIAGAEGLTHHDIYNLVDSSVVYITEDVDWLTVIERAKEIVNELI
jgi:hypothetical protein|tara:strand:- start:237 stop:425 length:189 start_codon:yes stop_codon:yes gene_type:complete